jgi:hypothetical protein
MVATALRWSPGRKGLGANLGTGENPGILWKLLVEGVGVEKVRASLSMVGWRRWRAVARGVAESATERRGETC